MRYLALITLTALALSCGSKGLQAVKPQLQPPNSPVDFGKLPVLNTKQVQVPLLDLGRATLTVSNVTVTGDGFSLISAPSEVTSGNTENIVVAFTPAAEKDYTGTLTFSTDDTDNASVTVQLTGSGSTRAVVSVMPATVDFGRVPECSTAVQQLAIGSTGTADLLITNIAFSADTPSAFSFVGSTKTPATVHTTDPNGLPGQILLTIKLTVAQGAPATLTGNVVLQTTDPDHQTLTVPLTATVNRAPVPVIAPFGNAAPGQTVTIDGSGSTDPDGDTPLTYKWTLRNKPLSSTTTIADPTMASTSMTLDPSVPGGYEVQLDVTDSQGVKSCMPARSTVVAAPAQKLLVEMFWDNAGTDLDLHVTRTTTTMLGTLPDDCFFQNRAPDWGVMGDSSDDPLFVRDALTGYGPEIWGYVNPVQTTYRASVVFANELLSPTPASTATVRVYVYGVLKAEVQKQLAKKGDTWPAVDIDWPSGNVTVVP